MKRTQLKRKTPLRAKTALKRTAKKRTKAPSIRLLKDKLWRECKRLTRERYGSTCYTCGATNLEGKNLQTGHGKPKGALPLRFQYDIRNLRPQCMLCNLHRGGMTDVFVAKMQMEEDGINFLIDACHFDEDYGTWIIRRDIPLIGGRDATIFIENLIREYRSISYEDA